MKKVLVMLLVGILITTNAWAMASKPSPETYQGCIQRPFAECSAFGNPWVPTWPAQKCAYQAGVGMVCKPNDPQPASFVPYNAEKWQACAAPIYQQCKVTFGK